MKITLSVIKADIGSIGGHIKPSARLKETVEKYVREQGRNLLRDTYLSSTGDDIAILMAHELGVDNPKIHELAWNAFMTGTRVAKEQGLYGAGQDLLKDAFSGNVRGLGPASCEMEFEERPNEPFVFFAADKTDPEHTTCRSTWHSRTQCTARGCCFRRISPRDSSSRSWM